MIGSGEPSFEDESLRAVELILQGDPRIGKVPKARKPKAATNKASANKASAKKTSAKKASAKKTPRKARRS
jgi:topoisomerase IA-like protein